MGGVCSTGIISQLNNLKRQVYPSNVESGDDGSVPKGKIFVALYDYEGRSLNELSFSAQETFDILDRSDDNWWKVQSRKTKEEGFIPIEYIADDYSLTSKPWYFGKYKRREAESALVLSQNSKGSFLIRDSESGAGLYSLSVRVEKTVKHFRIKKDEDNKFSVTENKFSSLDALVGYYKKNKISSTVKLYKPCARIEEPCTKDLAYCTIENWEVDRSIIELKKQIGEGNFGEVWDGTWNGRVRVAVKTLKPNSMQPEEFLEEAKIMKNLCHKNLIKLLAVCTQEEPMYIISEFMKKGSLDVYLKKRKGTPNQVKFHVQINIAAQVASGMAHIEMNKYIHRDLAARNVLVGENNIVKVADFGLSRLVDEDIYMSTGSMFPVKWTAPEGLTHREFSIKSDVWAYGILLYEILTHGGIPYPELFNEQVLSKLQTGYRLPIPPGCKDKRLYDIMLDTWKVNPMERPTFEILQEKLDLYFKIEGSEYLDPKKCN
ncbi:unnamed protein product [Meganyctiphanes norvegica]|uniref:Tyrosine-protein kinase n=1 Tax=Meganyctiphanes norvegica TaxID=48144 RepID=A0AAV2RXU6_MEGNR